MIICSSSNIDLIQGVSGYGTAADGATDWRIENTATGVFNILNSPNLLTPNVSIIDTGNIGIGTIPVTGTNKLQVQGNLNVSGGYFVAGVAFKPATAVLADTATALATSRNINGVAFNGTGNIDITLPYFNLTNKITAGNGISLTTGSVSTSPSISTNLTAGNGITISAAASPVIASSQWVTTGGNIYYNSGNVGIGTTTTATANVKLQVGGGGALRIANNITDYTLIGTDDTDSVYNTRIVISGNNRPNNNGKIEYIATTGDHVFYTTYNSTERMRITNGGNVVIGGNLNVGSLTNPSDSRIKKDIEDINDESALNKLLLIQPTTYNYIDVERNKGFGKVYGFIAQQIREVIPEAVSIVDNIIPNIYLVADYIDYVITLSSQPTKVIIKTNDKIKCYDKDNKEILVEVIEVIDDLTFRIKEIEYTDTKIFVYGTFVDDFHTLNKDYIFTLNVCATQELHRRIEAQNVLLKSQDDRIKDLETKVAMLMSSM